MSEWKEVILTEITTRIGDGLHGTPTYDENGDYYFINGNNILQGKIVIKPDTKKVNEEEFIKYSKPIDYRTILLSINGTIGNLAFYNNEKCILGKSACYINLNDKVDKQFIYYHFLHKEFQTYIVEIATGTTIPNVPLKGIREYSFELPPLPEQKPIAEVLSSLDDKIDLLHRQNKTLEQMAETLFRQWFVEEAEESWEDCTLEELCIRVGSGGTPSTKNESYYDGNINWYSTKELQDNFLLESEKKITKEGLAKCSAKLFPKNSVIIAIYAAPTVGRLGILQNEAAFNQAACGLVANETITCYEFLFIYLKVQRDELNAMASGSAQQNLNVKKIKDFPAFKVDSLTLNIFRETVRPMFKKIENNYIQIRALEKLRDNLLPKLMNGEIRISE